MFPEIPNIFSKYLVFSPKYLEKILNIPTIPYQFFNKCHNNDFVKSKTSFIGKTEMRHSPYKVTTSISERVRYIITDRTAAFSDFLPCLIINGLTFISELSPSAILFRVGSSELNEDNWNDNCEAKSEAKSPRPLRGLQVDLSLTGNVSYAVRK